MKRITVLLILAIAACCGTDAQAQWRVGAVYEARTDGPQHGFGLRLERGFAREGSSLQWGVRAGATHATGGAAYGLGLDIGNNLLDLSLMGSAAFSFVRPYASLGAGVEAFRVRFGGEHASGWRPYGLVQAGVALRPLAGLSPFVELQGRRLFAPYGERAAYMPAGLLHGELVLGVTMNL